MLLELSYGNLKFDRNPSVEFVTRKCRMQLSMATSATDPL